MCVCVGGVVCVFLACVVVAVPCSLLAICLGCTNDTWSHHLLSLQSRCCQNILLYFDDSSQWPAVYKRPGKVRGLALPAFHRNFFLQRGYAQFRFISILEWNAFLFTVTCLNDYTSQTSWVFTQAAMYYWWYMLGKRMERSTRVSTLQRNSRKHFVSIHSMSVFILSEQSVIFLLFAAPFHSSDRFLQVWNIFSVLLCFSFAISGDGWPSAKRFKPRVSSSAR